MVQMRRLHQGFYPEDLLARRRFQFKQHQRLPSLSSDRSESATRDQRQRELRLPNVELEDNKGGAF
jgi:hypothetical protein